MRATLPRIPAGGEKFGPAFDIVRYRAAVDFEVVWPLDLSKVRPAPVIGLPAHFRDLTLHHIIRGARIGGWLGSIGG